MQNKIQYELESQYEGRVLPLVIMFEDYERSDTKLDDQRVVRKSGKMVVQGVEQFSYMECQDILKPVFEALARKDIRHDTTQRQFKDQQVLYLPNKQTHDILSGIDEAMNDVGAQRRVIPVEQVTPSMIDRGDLIKTKRGLQRIIGGYREAHPDQTVSITDDLLNDLTIHVLGVKRGNIK